MPKQETITEVGYDVVEQKGADDSVMGRVLVFQNPITKDSWVFPLDNFACSDIAGRLEGKPAKQRVQVAVPGMIPNVAATNGHG